MKVAIVDCGSGNLRSVAKAVEAAAGDAGLRVTALVTSAPRDIAAADRVILPGVGAFADWMAGLAAVRGLRAAIERVAHEERRPLLGICVGMQVMASMGEEFETTPGLGWFPGAVAALRPRGAGCRVPHMGWNALTLRRAHPVLDGLDRRDVYFVHSFAYEGPDDAVLATTDHGGPVTAAIGAGNVLGVQFHPEKSQRAGLKLIANFLKWQP